MRRPSERTSPRARSRTRPRSEVRLVYSLSNPSCLRFELVVFVGDVEGGQDGDVEGIDGAGVLGDGAHLGIDEFGQALDIGRIGAAQMIALVVDLDADTVVIFRHLILAFVAAGQHRSPGEGPLKPGVQ